MRKIQKTWCREKAEVMAVDLSLRLEKNQKIRELSHTFCSFKRVSVFLTDLETETERCLLKVLVSQISQQKLKVETELSLKYL